MLALTRLAGESIVTSNGVRIDVLKVAHGRVHLGFTAPDSVRIWRTELLGPDSTICQACYENPCICVLE